VALRELSWLGGIIDGEGSIGLKRSRDKRPNRQSVVYSPLIQITNCDKLLMKEVADILDKRKINKYSWKRIETRNKKWRTSYCIAIGAQKEAWKFLMIIIQYLVSKRKLAGMLLEYIGYRLRKQQIYGKYHTIYNEKDVAKTMGIKEVPVVYVDIPDIDKEKELNLRLNKNLGEWDWDELANFDKSLLEEVGFSSEELDKFIKVDEDEFDAEEEYGKIVTPTTKLHDVFTLGNHRLSCGDATKDGDVATLMDGKKGRLIFCDPPYNVDYKSPGGLDYASTKFGGTGGKIFNDDKSDEECITFYTKALKNLYNHSTSDVTIYWWFANKNNWINREAFKLAKWKMSQIIIWLKNSMVFSRGQDYHRMYEPCMVGWKEKKSHYKNKGIGTYKDVFHLEYEDFSELMDVWYEKRDVTSKYLHPTQKPVRLAERGIRKNSQEGDIILDVFAGSGSTLMACEQMDRIGYLMELDPKYCDVIIKRWEKFTGDKAKKI